MPNVELKSHRFKNGRKLVLVQGDITVEKVDAIVNAANSQLLHGGGVAAAIVRRGGEIIQEESMKIRHVPVGSSALTGGGRLNASHVIHTVGPRWGEGGEDAKLASAVRSALKLAEENRFESVSMPAISAGIFGFPLPRCSEIILQATADFLAGGEGLPGTVRICLYDPPAVKTFSEQFAARFPGP